MSFAFQGFGLGEYFKAQQRLTDILDVFFWGTFDTPSIFLSLGHTLEDLSEEIEHLFDENSNPNSAILRSDNRLNVQQMLRVASHGLLDEVQALETLLQVAGMSRDRNRGWSRDFFVAFQSSSLEKVVLLGEKFAFQAWKLRLFFRILRKNSTRQRIPVLIRAQEALTGALELQSGSKVLIAPESSHFDIIQRFRDSCQFNGLDFPWNLKNESILLLILYWLYTTKLGLNESGNFKKISVRTYVNLIKSGWLLKLSCSDRKIDGFSEEARTLISILSSEVITMFQKLREQKIDCPNSIALASEGDYEIFVEDEIGNAYHKPVSATSDPHSIFESSFLESRRYAANNHGTHGPESTSPPDTQFDRDLLSGPNSPSPSIPDGSENSSSLKSDLETKSLAHSQSSVETGPISISPLISEPHPASPRHTTNLAIHVGIFPGERQMEGDAMQSLQSPPMKLDDRGLTPIISKSNYSWNQMVNKQELGIRPGEMEILPRDLPFIDLLVSYTGDRYGRWDSCSIRLFKDTASSTFRILALKDGLEDSFDEQFVCSQDNELVLEYAYHDHKPVIYIRRNKGVDQGNNLFYKFHNASDMFNLQLAFLDELVEADFHAVQTLRIKRNTMESYQKAGVQFWSEQNTNMISLRNVAGVGAAGALRSKATLKVHSTRIVMYMYQEKTAILVFVTDSIEIESRENSRTIRIRSSSHHIFKNSTTIKARILGTPEKSGGIPLDKAGLSIEDEDNFEDFKWFEIEFTTLEELHSFQLEFRKALNLRRKERIYVDGVMRLAAQGVRRN